MTTAIALADITIYPVVEQQGPFFDVLEFFPTLTKELLEENRSWLQPTFIDPASGNLVLCVQSFVIKTPHHNILIDSCVGNHKPRPARPFWNMMKSDRFEKGLAAAGLTVNDIDYVMCTHLHVDHVGWNTRLENGRWVPTFPKAKYVMADRELAYWTQKEKDDPSGVPWITDSVLPIVEAKRAQIVKSDFALNEFDPIHSDARPHDRPLLRAGRPARTGCVDHRRHDPLADPGKISRARHAGGLRLPTSRTNTAPGVRPLLRRGHGHVRDAFPFAFDRPRAALGRRLQIRRVSAAPGETLKRVSAAAATLRPT